MRNFVPIAALRAKIRDPRERRYFGALLGGKLLGLCVCLLVIFGAGAFFSAGKAKAQAPSAASSTVIAAPTVDANAPLLSRPDLADPTVSPMNTLWVLIAGFLVFFMQAGFMCLEAGFARTRETVNVVLETLLDTACCGIFFWAWGFAWIFGNGNGFIGNQYYFLRHLPDTYEATGVATLALFFLQFAFADTCSKIAVGAMLGRTRFVGHLCYSLAVTGFFYPIFGHWVWGPDGWLVHLQPAIFHDFSGSTAIHTVGGMISLAGALALGPRLGRKFKRDGGGPMPCHSMTLAGVGAAILWFGWYGFNSGSTLSPFDYLGIARVVANTTLSACAGGVVSLFIVYPRAGKWDGAMTINGLLAGLVSVTCPCYWISPAGALVIGSVAGVLVVLATDLLEWLRIDDPCGAWPVHGVCGMWGSWALGLFATGQFGVPTAVGADSSDGELVTGLFYGGRLFQLKAQMVGNLTIAVLAFAGSYVVLRGLKAFGLLRVSAEGEQEGIDLHEHGGVAYPEQVTSSLPQ
jgi:ammonium transporter, Amt family